MLELTQIRTRPVLRLWGQFWGPQSLIKNPPPQRVGQRHICYYNSAGKTPGWAAYVCAFRFTPPLHISKGRGLPVWAVFRCQPLALRFLQCVYVASNNKNKTLLFSDLSDLMAGPICPGTGLVVFKSRCTYNRCPVQRSTGARTAGHGDEDIWSLLSTR